MRLTSHERQLDHARLAVAQDVSGIALSSCALEATIQ
jgi:hypothetical protein